MNVRHDDRGTNRLGRLLAPLTTPAHPGDYLAAVHPSLRRLVGPVPSRAAGPEAPPPRSAPAAPWRPSAPSAGATARFAASGVTAEAAPDRPLLEVAEAAGLSPRFGCRRGICHRCTTPLLDGTVRELATAAAPDGGRRTAAGVHVRICTNAADGDVTLDC